MIYSRNLRPIDLRNKKRRSDVQYRSLVHLFNYSPKPSKESVKSNYLVKLNNSKPTQREGKAIIYGRMHCSQMAQNRCRIITDRVIAKQLRKNSLHQKLEQPRKEKKPQGLRKYFRHLNLQSQNGCTLMGSSIVMQKRDIKPLIKIRRYQQVDQNYESSVLLSQKSASLKFVRYDDCRTERSREDIGPWAELKDSQQIRFIKTKWRR